MELKTCSQSIVLGLIFEQWRKCRNANALSFACFYAVMAADVLQRFHPDVAKFLEAVLKNGSMGVCGEIPKIIEPKTRYVILQHNLT